MTHRPRDRAAAGDQQPLALEPAVAPAEAPAPAPAASPAPKTPPKSRGRRSVSAAVSAAEQAILEDLNDEQRAAVAHEGSPLLIVAGAGTGKTQVITRRIAWLIATKRARPDEILALTYTDKAATEMEARVDTLVPYGYVGATISTFHAFCDRLVREHAVELGLTSRLRVDTPAEIMVFLRERLFELGLERYMPLGRPDQHLKSLLSLFDQARDEDVSPAEYLAFAERLAAEAGDDPAMQDRAAAEREKAAAYAKFQELLAEHGRLDFGSQISLTLRLLRERAYLRREYQERFRFILVDEFQDTNHVQFELVRLLAGNGSGVTVVGDDDQSIYRFRGAKLENLMNFVEAFPRARVSVLKRNYRSRQEILDTAYRLIHENDPHRLESALGFDKRLIADRGDGGVIEHRHFAAASDEAEKIAEEIAEAIRGGERRPREFAVLARAHYMLDALAQALFQRGVRFRRVGQRGLYARDEIQLCLNALRMLADPADPTAAHLVLGHGLFGADPVDVARLGAAARRRNRDVLKVAAEALDGSEALADSTREAIARVLDLHRRLAKTALSRPTSEVLYEFVTESGLLGTLTASETAESLESVQNLNKLFGIVSRVGPILRSDRVGHFIRHLDLLIDMGDDPAAVEIESDEDAVSLLTAHNAKGLEFPVVYLVHLVEGRFPQYGRGEPLPFPPELRKGEPDTKEARYREERRLFYVGMTRAKDRIVLSHAEDYGGMRASKMSRFIAEALLLAAAPRGARGVPALESIARHAPPVVPDPGTPAPLPEDHPLTLSHSQIDDYLTCPLKYKYANVANVPLATDPRAMYGIAIHHALRIYQQHRLKGLPITADDVLAAFESAWSAEGFYSREHEERRLEEGRETLRRFVARAAREPVPLAVERTFKFRIGPTTVQGRWDRVDERQEGIVLVDYKTSELDDPAEADQRVQEDLRKGRQLALYALAYREMYGTKPVAVELQFVGPGTTGRAEVKDAHMESAADRVFEAGRGIRAAAYPPKPSPRDCAFCPYSRFCPHSAARSRG